MRVGLIAVLLAAALALAPNRAAAQAANYEVLRVDAGLTGGYSEGTSAGAFGGMIEPKYLLTDNIGVGARIEGMVIFGADVNRDGEDLGFTSASVTALLARAEYELGTLWIRPLAGLGVGIYSLGGHQSGDAGISKQTGRYLGFAPQVGLELGRVRFAVTYNAILGAAIEVEQTVGDPSTIKKFSQSYYTFQLSFHFGGTRLKKSPPPLPGAAVPPVSAR